MTLVDRIAEVFRAHPNVWLDYRALGAVGGYGGWRTRISDARRKYGMTIDNRWRTDTDGSRRWRVSEYCYRPSPLPVLPGADYPPGDHEAGQVLFRDVCEPGVDGTVPGETP